MGHPPPNKLIHKSTNVRHSAENAQKRTFPKAFDLGKASFSLAGKGFEPHDLRVMSPTSYQTALPRDIRFRREMPDTGFEPVRDFRLTGF